MKGGSPNGKDEAALNEVDFVNNEDEESSEGGDLDNGEDEMGLEGGCLADEAFKDVYWKDGADVDRLCVEDNETSPS